MLRSRVPFLALLLCAAVLPHRTSLSREDRLLAVDLGEFPSYRALRLAKLGPTPFNYGRIIGQPAFDPEYSVSIYAHKTPNKPTSCSITYIAATRSLWQSTDIGRLPAEGKRISTRRIDADFPLETATRVRNAVNQMLSGDHKPKPVDEGDLLSTDATEMEFSLRSGMSTLYGELNATLSPPGPRTEALLHVANLLVDYCKASPRHRSDVAKAIDHWLRRFESSRTR